MPRFFMEICRRREDYVAQLNRHLGRATMNLEWKNRFLESRDTVMVQFRELAMILEEFAHQMEQASDITGSRGEAVKRMFRQHHMLVENLLILEHEERKREAYLTVRTTNGRCVTAREAAELLGQAMGNKSWYAPKDTRALVTRQTATIHFAETGRYRMMYGLARVPREGERFSGDNFMYSEEAPGQVITSYAHRMREVIPSVGRVLYRLKEVAEYTEISEQIVEELRSIYQTDREETQRKNRSIKTFASTGCIVLDEQLERYLEEACEHKFTLDVIVRAPVNEILTRKWVDRYHLLQLVGDLYRNAYRAILKRREGGNILFCFGYNREGFYEISIYDNGEKFPEYIIKHLGERGVTTGGTGQGLADIFEVLKRSRASFVLNQNIGEHNIFTKGISIVFDGNGKVIVCNPVKE